MRVPATLVRTAVPVYGLSGLFGVLEDAEAGLRREGYSNVDCMFVPFAGPFGGGTNVCSVDGSPYQYGAELLNRPGGLEILETERANEALYAAQREAESRQIQEYYRKQREQQALEEAARRAAMAQPPMVPMHGTVQATGLPVLKAGITPMPPTPAPPQPIVQETILSPATQVPSQQPATVQTPTQTATQTTTQQPAGEGMGNMPVILIGAVVVGYFLLKGGK